MAATKTKFAKFRRASALRERLARGGKIPEKPKVIIIEKRPLADVRDGGL